MAQLKDYKGIEPAWCPGCGNFGILKAVNLALVNLGLDPHQVLMVSGIGQAGKLPHYSRANIFNSLHGRALAPAIGARIANPELTVLAIGGDGDGYGEGGNHFMHACRRNHDITYLVHDNQVYGLTKGQASPTSDEDFVTKTTPFGSSRPINPVALAIICGATLVCRGFAGDVEHLSEMINEGVRHPGFALIDVLQPCVSFNRKNTFQWYKERIYKLEEDSGYDPADRDRALLKALEWGSKIPLGVIYRQSHDTYEQHLPAIRDIPLVKQKVGPATVGSLYREYV